MAFKNLIEVPTIEVRVKAKKIKRPKQDQRGCDYCPLNKVKGINKILGRVGGVSIKKEDWKEREYYKPKKFFVFAQSPGNTENEKGKELIGNAGQFLWKHMAAAGITREMCDIQNVVRCLPADRESDGYLAMRDPTKEEIHCCSKWTEKALEMARPRVYLLFGAFAQKNVLKSEFKKSRKVFYSQRLKARVLCIDHPAYFLRGAPRKRLEEFDKMLQLAARLGKIKRGKYAYLEEMNYVGITTCKQARKAYKKILAWSRMGERVSADLEEGRGKDGNTIPLVYGFSGRAGHAYVFPLSHPDAPVSSRVRKVCRRLVRKLLRNPKIKKIAHHGSYEREKTPQLLNCEFAGFDYDTNYAEYFAKYPQFEKKPSFALPAIVQRRFPEFIGYKEIILPEALTKKFAKTLKRNELEKASDAVYKKARKKGGLNYAKIPWRKIVLYNAADNDIQKRIEITTRKHTNIPLLHVYMDSAVIMDRMERNGPLFDYKHYKKLCQYFPVRRDNLLKRIRKLSHDKEFNPASPKQVFDLIYKKLRLEYPGEGKPNTQKETMILLSAQHKLPKLITDWRKDDKVCSTYLEGFRQCADKNGGRLRTIWWLTGTRTGRMSSGGGPDGEDGVVNLQNVHGDPQLQNLLVSDVNWYDIYLYWKRHGDFNSHSWKRFSEYRVFVGFDQAQFELRVLAQRSGDPELIKIFNSGEDIHASVGHALTGRSIEDIKNDDRLRRQIKGCQFGLVYGLQGKGLASYLWTAFGVKTTEDEVNDFIDKYFRRFHKVKLMIERDRREAKENGWVETMLGFRRELDTSEREEGQEGAYWGNQAVNTPIQGTAHQMMLIGLVPIIRQPIKYRLLRNPQLEIHDAIYWAVKLKFLWKVAALGQYMLEKEPISIVKKEFNINWKIPLKSEPKAGFRFGTMLKDIDPKMGMDGFLNKWCQKNKEMSLKLKKEMSEVQAA